MSQKRKWLFLCEDFDDNQFYLDENGQEVCEDEAIHFIGDQDDADMEASDRSDLWEAANDAFIIHVTLESRGKVIEEPSHFDDRSDLA